MSNEDTKWAERISKAKPQTGSFGDYPKPGTYMFILDKFDLVRRDDGDFIAVNFICERGTGDGDTPGHKPGDKVKTAFMINAPVAKQREMAASNCTSFVRALLDMPQASDEEIFKNLLALVSKEQPAKGVAVRAYGRARTSKTTGNQYVAVTYETVKQSKDDIAARRTKLEANAYAPSNESTVVTAAIAPMDGSALLASFMGK